MYVEYAGAIYQLFAARLLVARSAYTDVEYALAIVKLFYQKIMEYPEHAEKQAAYMRKNRHHYLIMPMDSSRWKEYDYAALHTGLFGNTMRNIERQYQMAMERPTTQIGRILAECQEVNA